MWCLVKNSYLCLIWRVLYAYKIALELFSCLIYSLLATSRQNSVGTFAVVALMTGSMVDEYIPIEMRDQADNSTELIDIKTKYIYSVSLLVLKLKPEREKTQSARAIKSLSLCSASPEHDLS